MNFKVLSVLLFIGALFLNTVPSIAQGLEGKWTIAKLDTRHSTVLHFTKDSLMFYDFDQRQSATSYHIKDDRIVVDNTSIPIGGTFLFVNPDRLRLKPDRAKQPIDFVRLQPTQTSLTYAEIESLDFDINYHSKTLKINFKQVDDETLRTVRLETLDTTYFLSFYQNDKRMGAMPVKQVTKEEIMVYGFPEEPFIVTGERQLSNGNSTTNTGASTSVGKLTPEEAILGKWFYKHIQGRPSLSECTKKSFFEFNEDASLVTNPYAENHSNGNCVAGTNTNATYNIIDDNQIKVTEDGVKTIWDIQSLTRTQLVVKKEGQALTLTKEKQEL